MARARSDSTEPPHPEEHRVAMRLEGWATCLVVAHLSAGVPRAIETRQSAEFTPRDAGAPQGEVVWFHLFGM